MNYELKEICHRLRGIYTVSHAPAGECSPPSQPVQELEKVEKLWCCQSAVRLMVDSISINYKKLVSTAAS